MNKKIIGLLFVIGLLTVTLGCGSTPTQSTTSETKPVVFSSANEHIKYIWDNYSPANSFEKKKYFYYDDPEDYEGEGPVVIYWLKEKHLTLSYARDGMYMNTCKLTELTFKQIPEVQVVTVVVFGDLVYTTGDVREAPIYGATINREKASKINWDNVGKK